MKIFFRAQLIFCLFLSLAVTEVMSQSTNGGGDPSGRQNWFPNRGNVGIGTREPSQELEVIGSVKVTSTLFSGSIEVGGLQAGSSTFLNDVILDENLTVNGKVGIGIPNPTERLEISGSMRVSERIYADYLELRDFLAQTGIVSSVLEIGDKLYVTGLTGLGVPNPVERLEVEGNARVTQSLLASDGNFSNDLLVGNNIGVGKTDPLERLDVQGNIKASDDLIGTTLKVSDGLISQDLTVERNTYIKGNMGLGVPSASERLEVDGNVKISQLIQAMDGHFTNNHQVGNDLIVDRFIGVGKSGPSERIDVVGNIKASEKLMGTTLEAQDGIFTQDVSVSRNAIIEGNMGIGIASPVERLEVDGSAKVSQQLTANTVSAQEGVFVQALSTGGSLQVEGNTGMGVTSPTEKLEVEGNVKVSQKIMAASLEVETLDVNNSLEVNNLTATGNVGIGVETPAEKLEVGGNVVVNGDLRSFNVVSGSGEVIQDLKVGGNTEIGGGLTVNGPFTAPQFSMENLDVQSLTVANVLTIAGGGQIDGDLNVGGVIRTGIIDAQEFRTDGVLAFSLSSVSMDELAIGTGQAVPEDYKLAVGGNIIATGVDVKIPSKWPDYVFEDGYKKLTPQELEAYIKKYGHLPNLPSASEMESKEHMNLAEMNLLLLEKVEELALYIIELEKRIKNLETSSK